MRMLPRSSPVTARPAMFGSIRGMRDEILRLGERMMLCARAGALPHPVERKAARNAAIAGRVFSRHILPTRITGLPAYERAGPLMASPRRD